MEGPKFTIVRIIIDATTRQITAECALEDSGHCAKQAIVTLPHTDALASCREYVLKHVYQTLFEVLRFSAQTVKEPEGHDHGLSHDTTIQSPSQLPQTTPASPDNSRATRAFVRAGRVLRAWRRSWTSAKFSGVR